MKRFSLIMAVAIAVALVGSCKPKVSDGKTETPPQVTPTVTQTAPTEPVTTTEPTPPPAPTEKKSLTNTAWDFTWDNTKYKRLELTSDANLTLKGGDAPAEGIAGTYTLGADGAFEFTAGDIKDSGTFYGTVLKVAGVDGAKDPFYPPFEPPTGSGSSARR